MTLKAQSLTFVALLLLLVIAIDANPKSEVVYKNVTNVALPSSPPKQNEDVNQLPYECGYLPWICSRGDFPLRFLCCRGRCVDVTSNVDNCGLCGIRCPFNWQCCNGFCRDINFNPFNCGRCGNVCPIGSICSYGLCSIPQPLLLPIFSPGSPEPKPPQSQPHQPQYTKKPPAME